jgi:hypothetical protein
MYKCAIAGVASLCAIDILGCFASLACAPLSFKQALRFRQCSSCSVGFFCYSLGNITTRKKSMTTKTPSQRIALLEAKLARAKADERKQRTRRLIEVGAMLEPLGERVAALTAEQRKYFISRVLANWEALMEPRGNNQHQGDA